jgi:hypothetical protein
MARKITLTSGSVFNGNPITFQVQPNVITGTDSNKNTTYPSFHRVIMEVTCGMSGGNFEVIKMSAPVEEEKVTATVQIDISSALRTFRDSYEYSPEATTYPLVKFCIRVYDEYMLDGEVKTRVGEMVYPAEVDGQPQYLCTLFGGFSDFARFTSPTPIKGVIYFSRKPTDSPQTVAVGETFAYTPPFEKQALLVNSASLVAPTSVVTTIDKKGLQAIGDQKVYALPAEEAKTRQVFRFINSFGVLESVSVPKVYSSKVSVSSTSYAISRQETFNKFSRSTVRKTNNCESWLYLTDPLTLNWLEWYMHEFLMAEHIWMYVKGIWLPCTITPGDDTTLFDNTQQNPYTIAFTAKLDINGSPLI